MHIRFSLLFFILLFLGSCSKESSKLPNVFCIVSNNWEGNISTNPRETFKNFPFLAQLAENGIYFHETYSASQDMETAKKALTSGLHTGHLDSTPPLRNLIDAFEKKGYAFQEINQWSDLRSSDKPVFAIIYIDKIEASVEIIQQATNKDLIVFSSLSGQKDILSKVPLIFHQKDRIMAKQISNQAMSSIDILPTILHHLHQVDMPVRTDGQNFSALLSSKDRMEKDRILYWKYPQKGIKHSLLFNQWHFLQKESSKAWELYDLSIDSTRKDNILHYHPGKTKKFKEWIANNQ